MSTTETEVSLSVGDTVRVKPYQTQSMCGLWSTGYKSGLTAIVTGFKKDYDWRTIPNIAILRLINKDGEDAYQDSHPISELTVIEKGPGRFELGVTHPLLKDELKKLRYMSVYEKIHSFDLRTQGFSNAATYLADLYLSQDPRAQDQIKGMVRKDGSINPKKVAKLFYQLKLKIDPWALQRPIDPPEEFRNHSFHDSHLYQVHWDEVAKAQVAI